MLGFGEAVRITQAAAEGEGLVFTGCANAATSTLTTFVLGFGIVFIGLICLIVVINLLGLIMKNVQKKQAAVPAAAAADEIPQADRGALAAAVAASIATVMGKKVSGIRILSMKKVD